MVKLLNLYILRKITGKIRFSYMKSSILYFVTVYGKYIRLFGSS